MKHNSIINVKKLTYASVFIALSVIINVARVKFLNFSGFPIIASGYFLNPLWGFAVGFIADLIGFLLRGSGEFNVIFAITSGLTGFIPAFVNTMLKDKYPDFKLYKIIFSIAIGQIITSVLIAPIAIHLLYKKNLVQVMLKAFINHFNAPLNIKMILSIFILSLFSN